MKGAVMKLIIAPSNHPLIIFNFPLISAAMAAVGPPAAGHAPTAAAVAAAGAGPADLSVDPLSEVAPPPGLEEEIKRGQKRALDIFYTTQRLQVPEFPELCVTCLCMEKNCAPEGLPVCDR
jgi:hypothetical protein